MFDSVLRHPRLPWLRALSLEPECTDRSSAHQMGAQNAWAQQSRWSPRTCWVPWAGAGKRGQGRPPRLRAMPALPCPPWSSWRTCWSNRWGGPMSPDVCAVSPFPSVLERPMRRGPSALPRREFRSSPSEPRWCWLLSRGEEVSFQLLTVFLLKGL